MKARPRELFAFVVVGSAAAAVHFCTVVLLVSQLGWLPLLANVAAFLIAFQVSYAGHRFWTFSDTDLLHRQSLPRFFLVASGSFCLNELLYFLMLRFVPLPYWLSLAIVLLLVAILTFASSRLWAFARRA